MSNSSARSIEPPKSAVSREKLSDLPHLDDVETILLDMDGTLLDLGFDNRFWLDQVPQWYAELNDISLEESQHKLAELYHAKFGTLEWYCADFWSDSLGLNVKQKTAESSSDIALRPGTIDFLEYCKAKGKPLHLATNAHPDILAVKLANSPIEPYFQSLHSSHDFGVAKESPEFWNKLQQELNYKHDSTLFVDDADRILAVAEQSGIKHLVSVQQPDLSKDIIISESFPSVNHLSELLTSS